MMEKSAAVSVCVAVGWLGFVCSVSAETNSASPKAESGESRSIVGTDAEKGALRKQVENLAEALALARSEIGALRARIDRHELRPSASAAVRPSGLDNVVVEESIVLDVNHELRMVVISTGSQHGIRPGMQFAVKRKDKAVARVCVVDAREKIAGAVIVDSESDLFPEVGDRIAGIAARRR